MAFATITACAQIQGLDGYEKVECIDDCDSGSPPPPIGEDSGAQPVTDAATKDTFTPDAPPPPCENGVKDDNESDIDCGGACAKKCVLGKGCGQTEDCESASDGGIAVLCLAKTCALEICKNNIKDPTETDVDCGGPSCPKCVLGKTCGVDADCASGACYTTCIAKPTLTSVTPSYAGTVSGNVLVTLAGTGFVDKGGWTVSFGATTTTHAFINSTTLQANVPNGAAGKVDVSVLGMPGGTLTLPQAFLYVNLDVNFGGALTFGFAPALALGVGDHNADGKIDWAQDHGGTHFDVAVNSTTVVGTPAFGFTGGASPITSPPRALLVDVNADNRADLLHIDPANTLTVRTSTGTGFNAPVTFATGVTPMGMVASDFNGDAKVDIAVLNGGADVVSIFLGDGAGGFAAAIAVAVARGTRIAVADFNADGKKDLVTSASQVAQVNVLLGKGDGTFNAAVGYAVGAASQGIAVGDVDGDAKIDIIAANGGKLSTLRGKGDGTFNAAVDTTITGATNIPVIVASDLNADGRADVIFLDVTNSAVPIWVSGSGGAFLNTMKGFTGVAAPVDLNLADFDGDGKPDIIYTGTNGVRVHRRL